MSMTGPDLHGDPAPVDAGPGLGDLDGLVDRVGLDHRVPAENLLGLDERAVGDPAARTVFAVDGGCSRARRPAARSRPTSRTRPRPPRTTRRTRGVPGSGSRRVQDQQHVLHASLLLVAGPAYEAPSTPPTNAASPDPTRRES